MSLDIFSFGGLSVFGETISNNLTFADDKLLRLGTDGDQVLLNRSTTLNANTAVTSVLVGTPVTPALAANSLIISNVTTDGDILIAASDGGHSRTALFFDASTPDTYLYNVGGTWTAGATTWTIPAVTLGGAIAGGDRAFTNVGDMTFAAGSILASGSTNGNTLLIAANDTTFITLTTGATDVCTIANATMSGTWLASGTVTIPAVTLGGNVAGGGKVISSLDRRLYNETNLLENGNFEVGNPPTGWTFGGAGASHERSTEQIKIGSYSDKLTNSLDTYTALYQQFSYTYYRSRKVTIGAWVYATVASRVTVAIWTGAADVYGSYHSGTPGWEWLTVTATVTADASFFRGQCRIAAGAVTSAYFDGAIMVEGDSCPAFSSKPVPTHGGTLVNPLIQTTNASGVATTRATFTKDLATDVLTWSNITHTGLVLSGALDCAANYVGFTEMSAPGAGAANTARVYAVVGGDTLTDLAAVFQDGTVDIFAQEATGLDSPIFQFPDSTDLKLTLRKPDRRTVQFVATFPDGRDFVMRELRYPSDRWN